MAINDLLPPDPDVPPSPAPPVPPRRTAPITCAFCECSLAPNGDVLRMSEAAKALRDSGDVIERLTRTIAERDAAIVVLNKEASDLRALIPTTAPARRIFSS